MRAVIFDIDSTLANNSHRQHWLEGEKKSWSNFLIESDKDTPYKDTIWLCKVLYRHSTIILVTGRSEEYREVTEKWLEEYGVPYNLLLMREQNDYCKDYIAKKKIYKKQIEPDFNVTAVFDDNLECIEMWRNLGLTCYGVENSRVKDNG